MNWLQKTAQEGFLDWKTFLPQAIAENFKYLNHHSGQYSLENDTQWKNSTETNEQAYYRDLVFSNKKGRNNNDIPIFKITIELTVFPEGNVNTPPGHAVAEIYGSMNAMNENSMGRQGLYNPEDVQSNVRNMTKLKQFPYEIVENVSKMIESQDKLDSNSMTIQNVLDHKSPPPTTPPPPAEDTGEYGFGGNWWQK